MVKYACKAGCGVWIVFTAVHEDIPRCMPKKACGSLLSSFSRVRIPPCVKNVSPVDRIIY